MPREHAGFPSKVEVEYHVVTIRNAALPDDRGLLNPILEKHQDGCPTPLLPLRPPALSRYPNGRRYVRAPHK